MFDEKRIEDNRVAYLRGKADAVADLYLTMLANNRTTIKDWELKDVVREKNMEYERAWNKWADDNKIGGSRFTGEGKGEKK